MTKVIRFPDLDKFYFQNPVKDKDLTAPPVSPAKYDRYLIVGVPSGAWEGNQNNIAEFDGTSWFFITKKKGMFLYVEDENKYYYFNGTSWGEFGGGGGGSGDMEKSVYDTDDDGIVDKAEAIDDGAGNSATAEEIKNAVDKSHNQNTDTILQKSGSSVNQSQTDKDTGSGGSVYFARKLAQIFIPSETQNLTAISLYGVRISSGSGGIIEVRTTSGGEPTETVLTSQAFGDDIFAVEGENKIILDSPVEVINGVSYAVVIKAGNESAGRIDYYGGADNPYPAGKFYQNYSGTWDEVVEEALFFKIWLLGATVELINNGDLKENLSVVEGKTVDGRDISEDGTKLDTVEENAVSLPTVKTDADVANAINNAHSFNEDVEFQCFVVVK